MPARARGKNKKSAESPPRVHRREKRWALAVACAFVGASCVPYLLAWAMTPKGMVYMGFIWNPDDPNVYMSWMKQAADGRLFFEDLFSTEPQTGRFLHLLFFALGSLARATGLSMPAVHQVARVACGVFLLYTSYVFAAEFTESRLVRRLTLYLCGCASGLGWVYAPLDRWLRLPVTAQCVDVGYAAGGEWVIMPEAFPAYSYLLFAHFALAIALMAWAVLLVGRALRAGEWRPAVWGGVAGLFLGNIHTYNMIPLYLALGAAAVGYGALRRRWPWRELGLFALFCAISAPFVLYSVWFFRTDPVFGEKGATHTLSPTPLGYAISFGLPLLFALLALAKLGRRRLWRWLPVVCWLALGFVAVYLPAELALGGRTVQLFTFQRKMAEGLYVPICLLGALGMDGARRWLARRWPRGSKRESLRGRVAGWKPIFALAATLACLPSTAWFVNHALETVRDNNFSRRAWFMPPYYLTEGEAQALRALDELPRGETVFCLPYVGSYVPGASGQRVYVGHWAETLNFARKVREAAAFFSPAERLSPEERGRLLLATGATIVLCGPWEQGFAGGEVPEVGGPARLAPLGKFGETWVFRVERVGQAASGQRRN